MGLLDKLVREAVKNKLTVLGDIPLGKVRKCEFFGGGKSSWNFLKFIRQRTNLCIHEEKNFFFFGRRRSVRDSLINYKIMEMSKPLLQTLLLL